MKGMHRLEDLAAFTAARALKLAVYQLIGASGAHRDYEFATQLRGAAASVEANIAEGYRRSRRDFARFLLIARSSLDEVEVRLRDGVDRSHYPPAALEPLMPRLRHATSTIMGLRRFLMTRG